MTSLSERVDALVLLLREKSKTDAHAQNEVRRQYEDLGAADIRPEDTLRGRAAALLEEQQAALDHERKALELSAATVTHLEAKLADLRQSLAYLCEVNDVTDSRFIEATFKLHEFDAEAADKLLSAHRRYLKERGDEQGGQNND